MYTPTPTHNTIKQIILTIDLWAPVLNFDPAGHDSVTLCLYPHHAHAIKLWYRGVSRARETRFRRYTLLISLPLSLILLLHPLPVHHCWSILYHHTGVRMPIITACGFLIDSRRYRSILRPQGARIVLIFACTCHNNF